MGVIEGLNRQQINLIASHESKEKELLLKVCEGDQIIEGLKGEIAGVADLDKRLQDELSQAQKTGEQLREQLRLAQLEFEEMKTKTGDDDEAMRKKLLSQSQEEVRDLESSKELMQSQIKLLQDTVQDLETLNRHLLSEKQEMDAGIAKREEEMNKDLDLLKIKLG